MKRHEVHVIFFGVGIAVTAAVFTVVFLVALAATGFEPDMVALLWRRRSLRKARGENFHSWWRRLRAAVREEQSKPFASPENGKDQNHVW